MEDNSKMIEEKVKLAEDLIKKLEPVSNVDGVSKLEKKIRQEIKFLQKISKQKSSKTKDHLFCSNLLHLGALVETLVEAGEPVAVLKVFSSQRSSRKVVIDLVANNGLLWVKVIARNARALELHSRGDQAYGQRSILDQARDWVSYAEENRYLFQIPEIRFQFHGGITEKLKNKLEQTGVHVEGEIKLLRHKDIESDADSDDDEEDCDVSDQSQEEESVSSSDCENVTSLKGAPSKSLSHSGTLNLDITAMIAYVSALTNGFANYIFKEPILSQQAEWERLRPVKLFLEKVFAGQKLICCESAVRDFRVIVETLGGDGEKARAKNLLENVVNEIVPDGMSERLKKNLYLSGKIKERSRAIFGTGDLLQVVTVSANSGFVRAAQGQGINLAVIIHESRALTEGKMISAIQISNAE